MKAKKNKREPSRADANLVSAGLRDVLGIAQWRKEHPKATWQEIEAAVDEQVNQLRAQLIQDVVQMGESEEWSELPQEERPKCTILSQAAVGPWRADALDSNDGRRGGQTDAHLWNLPYLWGRLFSRLHEQLGLSSAGLTPRGEETLVRLSTWMPFEPARELLQELVGMQVSTATAWRATRATGQAALAVCEQKRERLQREMPPAPAGADKQAMSGDGAFAHLVGGEWVEVKTLTLGEITRNKRGEVCLQQISSFSRLADAEHFAEAALVETHRRGVEQASEVCAVQDGAEWRPRLVDYHCADAVRILDAGSCRRIPQ